MRDEDVFFRVLKQEPFEVFHELAERDARLLTRRNSRDNFLLHVAVMLGRIKACRYLMARGASPTQPGHKGATPLHYAAYEGTVDILRLLLESADEPAPPTHRGMRPLHVAAAKGRLKAVQSLVDAGASLRSATNLGRLPIHFAAGAGQQKTVKDLLRLDLQLLEAADSYGQKPRHWAAMFSQRGMALMLEEYGADNELPDYHGRSARYLDRISHITGTLPGDKESPQDIPDVHRSVGVNDLDGLLEELRRGCNLCVQNAFGRNALHLAAFFRHRRIYSFLAKAQLDLQVRDAYGWTPVALLSFRGMQRKQGGAGAAD